jgi:hypothetical protein
LAFSIEEVVMFDLLELHKAPAAKPDGHHEAGALSKLFLEIQHLKPAAYSATESQGHSNSSHSFSHLPSLNLYDPHVASFHPLAAAHQDGSASPALLTKSDALTKPDLLTEIGNVGKELLKGAGDEIVHHPLKLAAEAACSAAMGVALGFASPAVLIGVAAVGIGAAIWAGSTHMHAMIRDTEVVANPDAYSAHEVALARHCVPNFGGSLVETTVQIAAGAAGGWGAALLKGAMNSAAAVATAAPETMMVSPSSQAAAVNPCYPATATAPSGEPIAACSEGAPGQEASSEVALLERLPVSAQSVGGVARGQLLHTFADIAQNVQNALQYLNALKDAQEGQKFA